MSHCLGVAAKMADNLQTDIDQETDLHADSSD